MSGARILSSITRWLPRVAIGCVALGTAQPVTSAGPVPEDRSGGTLLIPSQEAPPTPGAGEGGELPVAGSPRGMLRPEGGGAGWRWLAVSLFCAAGAGWFYLKRRGGLFAAARATERRIVIEETRSLGNRQYLVLAGCGRRRFLIGVAPGRIQLIAPVDEAPEEAKRKEGVPDDDE
ncbi:flagellar biogenesis protein [Opitutaceae bacterium TAV1]|nr:flagellar biogenesis protein [Opitutaceae bacterium TAV1]